MAIINIPEDQLQDKLKEALIILGKLRKYKKIWDENFGYTNRNNLRRWENTADKFLSGINVELTPEEQQEYENDIK